MIGDGCGCEVAAADRLQKDAGPIKPEIGLILGDESPEIKHAWQQRNQSDEEVARQRSKRALLFGGHRGQCVSAVSVGLIDRNTPSIHSSLPSATITPTRLQPT